MRVLVLGTLLAIAAAAPAVPAADNEASGWSPEFEHQVKIGFLFNFAKFVEWPEASFPTSLSPLTIGVLGSDPFSDAIEGALAGKTVNSRPIVVRRLRRGEPAGSLQILFLSPSLGQGTAAALDAVKTAPVLTVGDLDRFTALGGIINFRIVDHKVRFEVNVDAAARAGLKISSQLLSVATVVRDESRGGGR